MKSASILLGGLLAVLLVGCTKSDDDACTLVGCENMAAGTFDVTVAPADLVGVDVTVCRDGACTTSTIVNTAQQGATPNYECPLTLTNPLSCYVITSGSGVQVRVVYEVDSNTAHDGEVFTVKLGKSGEAELLSTEKTVTYEQTTPNGPDCAPTCRQASLN